VPWAIAGCVVWLAASAKTHATIEQRFIGDLTPVASVARTNGRRNGRGRDWHAVVFNDAEEAETRREGRLVVSATAGGRPTSDQLMPSLGERDRMRHRHPDQPKAGALVRQLLDLLVGHAELYRQR
jgi:hypothetical protein